MEIKPQELIKSLVAAIGPLIDARIRIAEVTIKANTEAAINKAKEELKTEIHALRDDLKDHEKRIETVEDHLGLTHKN